MQPIRNEDYEFFIYDFPAVFVYVEEGVLVYFPDLEGCISEGKTEGEALQNAHNTLYSYITALVDAGKFVPDQTPLEDVQLKENENVVMISCCFSTLFGRVTDLF
ncbi:type II toxin-antitoxin system HicB family antitoxin [Bacillus thuringiensis]